MVKKISPNRKVYELLNKKTIIMRLKKTSKEDAIKQLIDCLPAGETDERIRNDILSAIKKRESIESTGIGNGIAIPHAKLNTIKNFYVILALSKEGIDFNATDKKPVYIIFLVLSKEQDKVLYIRILARLARLLHNNEFRIGLTKKETPEEVINFIKKYESF